MAAILVLFWPMFSFAVLPLLLKASGRSRYILPGYAVGLLIEVLIIYASRQSLISACAINESECLGAESFIYALIAVHAAFGMIGAMFAILSRRQKPSVKTKGI